MSKQERRAYWLVGACTSAFALLIAQYESTPARSQPSRGPEPTQAQLTQLQRLEGEFVYESGVDRIELWRAIERGTREVDAAHVRRDRARLEQLLWPPPRIQIAVEADSAGVASMAVQEGRTRVSASLAGEAKPVRISSASRETALQMSQRLDGKTLLRVIDGHDFHQERRLTVSEDRQSVVLEIHVTGLRLRDPLTARAIYRRR